MDYERLTNKGVTMGGGSVVFYNPTKILDRLVELEDKIESGYIKILPCKIGDPVYKIKNGQIEEWKILTICFHRECIDISFTLGGVIDQCNIDKNRSKIFLTRSEAEARLEELKNGIQKINK